MNKIFPSEIVTRVQRFKDVQYDQIEVDEQLYVTLNTGSQKLSLLDSEFYQEVHIVVSIYGTANLDFSRSVFNEKVYFNIGVSHVSINCNKTTFKKGFVIESTSEVELQCIEAVLQDEIGLENCRFSNIDFAKCQNGTTYCTVLAMNTDIKNCNFNDVRLGEVYFNNAVFHSEAKFDRSNFVMLNCSSVQFEDAAYFNNAEFYLSALFNGAQFKQSFVGPYMNKTDSAANADFSGCLFYGNAYFDYGNWGSFTCIRSTFQQPVSFHLTKIRAVDFIGTFFQSIVDFSNTNYPESTTETFRIIKSELLKAQDRAGYLYYQSKELNQYERTSIKWKKRPLEYFMLVLNRLSTNHGIDWGRGVVFSLTIMVTFYSIYINTLPGHAFRWGFENWESFWSATNYVVKNFFVFIALFREFSFIEGTSPNAFSYFIDFLGRIFIGYGIYQTIQAFRKYGKG
jgi:uncharacterized protein YjbI with pentapeptide repeats